MKPEEILVKGKVELIITKAGIRQKQVFLAEYEQTIFGKIPFLVCSNNLPISELIKVAEETGLPVKCSGQKIFPKGKTQKDFVKD